MDGMKRFLLKPNNTCAGPTRTVTLSGNSVWDFSDVHELQSWYSSCFMQKHVRYVQFPASDSCKITTEDKFIQKNVYH